MNFQDAARRFAELESGTDTFKHLSHDAFALMKSDAANAALYFVIGTATRSYVQRYEDQGVPAEAADKAKAVIVGFNNAVLRALEAGPAERLSILNEVAIAYQYDVHDF